MLHSPNPYIFFSLYTKLLILMYKYVLFFSFLSHPHSQHIEILGQGLNLSSSCNVCHHCHNEESLTHSTGVRTEPTPLQQPELCSWGLNPLHHSGNATNAFFFFFCLFRATPRAYGSSQARGQVQAAAAVQCPRHSNARSLTH